jgi:hypothetical protein
MAKKNQHVVKRSDGWAVRDEGDSHDTSLKMMHLKQPGKLQRTNVQRC